MLCKNLFRLAILCFLVAGIPHFLTANPRTTPIDVYVIVDSSTAMERVKDDALGWLSSVIIDTMLRSDDRIWIWTAGSSPRLIYSGTLENKELAKTALRSIQFDGSTADYRSALLEAQVLARRSDRITYTLLVSSSAAADQTDRETELAGLLRYSRVESFPGWRVITVGLDLENRVRR